MSLAGGVSWGTDGLRFLGRHRWLHIRKEDRHSMVSRKSNQSTAKADNNATYRQTSGKKTAFTSRYVAVDSHLAERKGSLDFASSLAGERPAGRKLAQDIANACNQLDSEGYDVVSIFPTIGGRAVEVFVEAEEDAPQWKNPSLVTLGQSAEDQYETMTAGYSVTDGAIITAKLRR